jgi:hypothetical protein
MQPDRKEYRNSAITIFIFRDVIPNMPIKVPITLVPTLIVLVILFIIPWYFLSVLGATYGYNDRTRWFGKYFLDPGDKAVLVIVFYIFVGLVISVLGFSGPLFCLLGAGECMQPVAPGPATTPLMRATPPPHTAATAPPATPATPVAVSSAATPANASAAATRTVATPSLSPAPAGDCAGLVAAAADDSAFLDFLTSNDVVRKIDNVADHSCAGYTGAGVNQDLVKGPRPKTAALVEARKYLVSATTYCQAPDSASAGRTADDLARAEELIREFRDAAAPCQQVLPYNVSPPGPGSKALTFSGSGSDLRGFKSVGGGGAIFRITYAGEDEYGVVLENGKGQVVRVLASGSGPYSGVAFHTLVPGDYFLRIMADGAWTVEVTVP